MDATINTLNYPPAVKKYGEAAIHLSLWLFFYAEKWINNWAHLDWDTSIMMNLAGLSFPAMFYVNAFWLIPVFLRKGKILQYTFYLLIFIFISELFSAAILACITSTGNIGLSFSGELQKWFLRNFPISGSIFGLLLSFAYRFSKDWIYNEREKEKLTAEKSSAELAYLKSQVNPHFLFNTLNNLYAVALEEKGDRTAEGIARLGSLMRYSLHDSQADYILLSREIDYIERYISLQRLRIREEEAENILFKSEGEIQTEKIAPMLLLPFIENAFKYGVSPTQTVQILVDIKLEEGVLEFLVENSISNGAFNQQSTGLGISSVKKRLAAFHPGKYDLSCEKKENIFQVRLKIDLTP